jgi:flagellin
MNILDATEPQSGAGKGKFVFQVGANGLDSHKIEHTLDGLTFGATSGTASFASEITSGVQTATLTFGDDYKAGDVISINVNGKFVQYTVTPENVAATTGATNITSIVDGVKDALDALEATGKFAGLTTGSTATGITFVGADGQVFETSVSANSGKLANIAPLSVTSQANSDGAIKGLDTALREVNEARAEIGAVINRLTYAADNLSNVSMNTSESRSRILDTDYAKASAELARTQIISQAATAMLAQANQMPQAVLQLLQG